MMKGVLPWKALKLLHEFNVFEILNLQSSIKIV